MWPIGWESLSSLSHWANARMFENDRPRAWFTAMSRGLLVFTEGFGCQHSFDAHSMNSQHSLEYPTHCNRWASDDSYECRSDA